jgi:mycothiol synthase
VIELGAVPPDAELDRRLSLPAARLRVALEDGTPQRWRLDDARRALSDAIAIAADAGHSCRLAIEPADQAHDDITAALGMHRTRELLQLRRPLPLPPELRPREPVPYVARPFVAGRDDECWVEVNNRAFSWHPEQGGWTLERLHATQAEPWYDPDGFLVSEIDGELAGFCWTKIHDDTEPPMGEIFVIAVDPDVQAHGLGRFLAIAGLDWLTEQGITRSMLYVESDNVSARALYDELGFTTHHVKRWWTS